MKFRFLYAGLAALTLGVLWRTLRRSHDGSSLSAADRARLLDAVKNSFSATMSAFETGHTDYEARDARASEAASALEAIYKELEPSLGALQAPCSALVDAVERSQLQLMAFAINRKNRGTPDSAQTEAEAADSKIFKREAGEIYKDLIVALT